MTEKEEIQELKQKITDLQAKLMRYEENGVAKLYFSLNRKAWEMADVMNATNLKTISLDDPKDKTFDRLKIIWQDSASIATAVESLGRIAKVTGDEEADVSKKPFVETIAQARK